MGEAVLDVTVGDDGFLAAADCDLSRRVLRDGSLAEEFAERGYVVTPFLAAEEVARLRSHYEGAATREGGVNPEGAYNDTYAEFSVIHSHPEFRREALATIGSVFGPHTDRLLDDYRPLMANYVNKRPGKGIVPAHQNFSVVDEARYQSVSVWVPLVDCTVENGAMWMLDGSHLRLRGRRGMWAYQCFGPVEDRLLGGLMAPLEVPAGHAVVLDDATVHYSPPNGSDADRLAIQYVMIPAEADALWFRQVGGTDVAVEAEVLRVDEQYFFEFWHGDGDERHGERVGGIDVPTPALGVDELDALLGIDRPASPPGSAHAADESTATSDAAAVRPPPSPEPIVESQPRPVTTLLTRMRRWLGR